MNGTHGYILQSSGRGLKGSGLIQPKLKVMENSLFSVFTGTGIQLGVDLPTGTTV